MSLVTIDFIDSMLKFVHLFITYVTLLILVYYACHCNFNCLVNFILTLAEKKLFAVSVFQK